MGNLSQLYVTVTSTSQRNQWKLLSKISLALISILGLLLVLCHGIVESLWFAEVGYQSMFWIQRISQILLWLLAMGLTLGVMGGNLKLAQKLARTQSQYPASPQNIPGTRGYQELVRLIGAVACIFLASCIVLIHYGHEGWLLWFSKLNTQTHSLHQLSWDSLTTTWTVATQFRYFPIVLIASIAFLLLAPLTSLLTITVAMGIEFGCILAHQWAILLAAFQSTPFRQSDSLFHIDIRFYVFQLPFWELFQFMALGISLMTFLGVAFYYLTCDRSLRKGRFPRQSPAIQRHLYALATGLMLAIALSWGMHCFTLLYSSTGALYGAGYTDRHILLPVRIALCLGALAIALVCGYRALYWDQAGPRLRLPNLLGGYLGIAFGLSVIVPGIVQNVIVTPNELARELPYIQASIAATREAFGLNTIQTETFTPSGRLTPDDLKKNELTTRNIRLWDTSPLLKANRQLQRIRPYYEFADADIDRYAIASDAEGGAPIKQQVLISARELDFKDVPEAAQTWLNKRLIYTHGYGFTVSPVNRAATSGLPDYIVQDIEAEPQSNNVQGIPIQNPRIYFGELTDHYILTGTKVKELDYPQGNENALTTYAGAGGIPIQNFARRLVFATTLRDWRMLLSPNILPETRVVIHRRIQERVRRIAPFLRFDQDPYLVTTSNTDPDAGLYWVIDAYTLSDRYPYSDPGDLSFNYIRNSIKVVVDAYNGSVNFYSVEPDEPILKTWQKLFPDLIQPMDAMPQELRAHLRYPIDLFQAQSETLLTYHMTDPQVFYNREDQWRFPREIYGNEPSQVQPYYLIMKLPEEDRAEFILLSPFTPAARNNLIAWMAARSDGEDYGKRLLYQFPKQELVLGPEQVEALINQDPAISQQITLWNRQGSRVLQGNLLVIPIERSLLYVEPLYLEAEKTGVPTLARVVVLYQNKIVMAPSLDEALAQIFENDSATSETIVRDVQVGS